MSAKLDDGSLELARSMDVASIPEKLRCATCDKLAINAMKLPCCDNTICGDCHDTMSASECPICTHSPFSADMCVPAKGLQMTIKAFIKTERKKRVDAAAAAGEASGAGPADTPAPAVAAPADTESAAVAGSEEENATMSGMDQDAVAEAAADPDNESEAAPNTNADQDEDEDEDDDVVITTEMPEHHQDNQQQQHDQQGEQHEQQSGVQPGGDESFSDQQTQGHQLQQQGFGFDPSMGNFGNGGNMNMPMGMNGFNGMMPGFGMGMPNMMGMPGMGMDPSMMFNGSFGGNMGDMSMMGMGMGGMGNGMMGGGMGNFGGMGGPGFFPDQGNYMQSNYGNAQRQNFSNDRGYGRGFGRGFGRGARGNWNPRGRGGAWGHQQGHQQQNGFHQQLGPQGHHNQSFQQGPQRTGANSEGVPLRRSSPVYEGRKATPANPDAHDHNRSGDKPAGTATNMADDTNTTDERSEQTKEVADQQMQNENGSTASMNVDNSAGDGNGELAQIQSVNHSAPYEEYDESAQYQQEYGFGHHNSNFGSRGGYRGRGGFINASHATELTPAPAPPVNAPKGPKAMLQGLPNTGWSGRNLVMATPPKKINTPTPAPQSEPRKLPNGSAKQDETMQDDYPRREPDLGGQDKPASRSHSKSRRRSRSPVMDDGQESDGAYSRRKEGDRRKRKDYERRHDDETEDSRKKYRSRSESRNDDGSRRRQRDKDEDQHRSSRSHRDRSRDKDRRRRHERDGADDRDEYSRRKSKTHHERAEQEDHEDSRRGSGRRHSRREDDHEHEEDRKDRSHRSSRHDRPARDDGHSREYKRDRERERERPRAVIEPPSDELGFKIKGSKSARAGKDSANNNDKERRSSVVVQSVVEAPAPPAGDIYAAERAAAQGKREAREAQRRSTVTHPSSLGKRGREEDDAFDAPRGPKGDRSRTKKGKNGRPERKISYKYEDEVGGGDDDRDANRWR